METLSIEISAVAAIIKKCFFFFCLSFFFLVVNVRGYVCVRVLVTYRTSNCKIEVSKIFLPYMEMDAIQTVQQTYSYISDTDIQTFDVVREYNHCTDI